MVLKDVQTVKMRKNLTACSMSFVSDIKNLFFLLHHRQRCCRPRLHPRSSPRRPCCRRRHRGVFHLCMLNHKSQYILSFVFKYNFS